LSHHGQNHKRKENIEVLIKSKNLLWKDLLYGVKETQLSSDNQSVHTSIVALDYEDIIEVLFKTLKE
jgi:hypothetical protein